MIPLDAQRDLYTVMLALSTGFFAGAMAVAWLAQPVLLLPGQDPPAWVGPAKLCIYGGVGLAALSGVGFMWSDWRLRAGS
jgi:hypothetical protein